MSSFKVSLFILFMKSLKQRKVWGFLVCIGRKKSVNGDVSLPVKDYSPKLHRALLKDNTISYCFTLFICGGPCRFPSLVFLV